MDFSYFSKNSIFYSIFNINTFFFFRSTVLINFVSSVAAFDVTGDKVAD